MKRSGYKESLLLFINYQYIKIHIILQQPMKYIFTDLKLKLGDTK